VPVYVALDAVGIVDREFVHRQETNGKLSAAGPST
jgi:hypothetical protein